MASAVVGFSSPRRVLWTAGYPFPLDVVVFLALLLFLGEYSPYHTLSPCFLETVKDEPEEARTRKRRHGGSVVIREWRQSCPPRQLQPVKRVWTPPPEYKVVVSIDDPQV
jgi:hypothetical protein